MVAAAASWIGMGSDASVCCTIAGSGPCGAVVPGAEVGASAPEVVPVPDDREVVDGAPVELVVTAPLWPPLLEQAPATIVTTIARSRARLAEDTGVTERIPAGLR